MVRICRALPVAMGLFMLQGCEEEPTSSLVQSGGPVASQESEKKLDLEMCQPDQQGFTLGSNSYFPMEVGLQWFYAGDDAGELLELQITVLDVINEVDGVPTRVIEEREWVDGELLEVSWNYFTRAANGTICYYGEDVDIFEEDGSIVHDGAWCAEDNPEDVNQPGIFMPSDPEPGMTYVNEIAPGIAMDTAKIVGTPSVTVGGETFTETIRVEESTPLEKGKGYKIFAAGTGLIIDGPAELVSFIQGASAPGPPIPSAEDLCGEL